MHLGELDGFSLQFKAVLQIMLAQGGCMLFVLLTLGQINNSMPFYIKILLSIDLLIVLFTSFVLIQKNRLSEKGTV